MYVALFFGSVAAYLVVGFHAMDDPSIIDHMGDGSIKFKVKNLVSQIAGLGNMLVLFPIVLATLGVLSGLVHRVCQAFDTLENAVEQKRLLDMNGTRVCIHVCSLGVWLLLIHSLPHFCICAHAIVKW
jgi:hypothetical protein